MTIVDDGAARQKRLKDPQRPSAANSGSGATDTLTLFRDIRGAFQKPGFWLYGAWIDTSLQHRSHALGAFWMISGTLVFVIFLGTLYSRVLRENREIYYAHLAIGYVVWVFMQQLIGSSPRLFKKYQSLIQNGYINYAGYELRLVTAQLINLSYNLTIVIGVILLTPVHLNWSCLVLLLTFPLVVFVMLGTSFLLSVMGARYPDLVELVQTLLRLAFFVTPIIWMPASTGKGALVGAFLYANPFYYLIEIIRTPIVQGRVPWLEIAVVLAAAPLIWLMASLAYRRAKPYIPLWV